MNRLLYVLGPVLFLIMLGFGLTEAFSADSHAHDAAHAVPEWSELVRPLLYRSINFVLFVAILVFVMRKPISQALVARKKEVEEIIKASAERKAWAEQMYADYNRRLENIGKAIADIRASLQKEGEEEAKRLRTHAEKLAESVRQEARIMADAELEDFKNALRLEVTQKAADTARETIMRVVTEQDDQRLSKDFLTGLGGQGGRVQ